MSKHAAVGEVVSPEDELFEIADTSILWVLVDIYEKDLASVKVGNKVIVKVTAYPEEKFLGRLSSISPTMDEKTRTVKARVEVVNPEGKLKIEMFARALILKSEEEKGSFHAHEH